jgi:hypothetical protein
VTNAEIIRTLRLFNEKAAKLQSLRFTQCLRKGEVSFGIAAGPDGQPVADRHGPTEEEIDAFVLTYRFFVQDNEPTSLRHIEELYLTLPFDTRWKNAVRQTRGALNRYLDAGAPFKFRGKSLTRREFHDTFLWGGLAHAHPAKKALFDQWRSDPAFFALLLTEFVAILSDVLRVIAWLQYANDDVLAHYPGTDCPTGHDA